MLGPCPFHVPQFTPDLLEAKIRSGRLSKSHSHYKDFLDLRGDGRVVLYKRADHQNPKWTVRLKIPTVEGFVVKSTKTTDDRTGSGSGLPPESKSFSTVIDDYIHYVNGIVATARRQRECCGRSPVFRSSGGNTLES